MNSLKCLMVAFVMLALVASAGSFFVYVAPLAIVGLLAFVSGVLAALIAGVMIGNAYREVEDAARGKTSRKIGSPA
jgi:hypothetical protein